MPLLPLRLALAALAGLPLCLTLCPGPARAQTLPRNCAAHDIVVERLASGYGESRQSIALGSNNAVIEIFAAPDTGTWTLTMTMPGGPTCLVASGHAFENLAESLPNTDPPA